MHNLNVSFLFVKATYKDQCSLQFLSLLSCSDKEINLMLTLNFKDYFQMYSINTFSLQFFS